MVFPKGLKIIDISIGETDETKIIAKYGII